MKFRITHNDIIKMVTEAMNRLDGRSMLMEIAAQDAYARFYQGKIPEKAYTRLMNGSDQMTPLHKLAADHVVPLYANKQTANANRLVRLVSDFWANANNETRQYVIKVCKDEAELLKSNPDYFKNAIVELSKMKSHSEGSYIERGFEVLYEDEQLRLTCTKSYSSSCRHYGKSHWCTASDQFGEYDGFRMFKRYSVSEKSVLIQFFIKQYPEETCQAQIGVRGKFGQICNWDDYAIYKSDLDKLLKNYGIELDDVFQKYIAPNLERLYKETVEIFADEEVYYRRKKAERIKKMIKNIVAATSSPACEEFARQRFASGERWSTSSDDGLFRGSVVKFGDMSYVYVTYQGKNETEENFLEAYYDDEEYYMGEYGVITTAIVFAFDSSGNIVNKYQGDLSIYNPVFLCITDRYSDELYDCVVNYVVKTSTGEVMLKNVEPVNLDSCDEYYWDLERDEPEEFDRLFNGDFQDGVWYVFANTKAKKAYGLNQETGQLLEIPYQSNWF